MFSRYPQMFLSSFLLPLLLLAVFRWYFKRRKLPPGPPAVPVLGSFPFLQLRRGLVDWATDPRVTKHRQISWQIVPIYISFFNHIPRIVAVTR